MFGNCQKRWPTRCSAGCADWKPLYLPPLRRAKPRRRLAGMTWVHYAEELEANLREAADGKHSPLRLSFLETRSGFPSSASPGKQSSCASRVPEQAEERAKSILWPMIAADRSPLR
jgi:hypothetical protein